jgi:hypothetical protein
MNDDNRNGIYTVDSSTRTPTAGSALQLLGFNNAQRIPKRAIQVRG